MLGLVPADVLAAFGCSDGLKHHHQRIRCLGLVGGRFWEAWPKTIPPKTPSLTWWKSENQPWKKEIHFWKASFLDIFGFHVEIGEQCTEKIWPKAILFAGLCNVLRGLPLERMALMKMQRREVFLRVALLRGFAHKKPKHCTQFSRWSWLTYSSRKRFFWNGEFPSLVSGLKKLSFVWFIPGILSSNFGFSHTSRVSRYESYPRIRSTLDVAPPSPRNSGI